LVLGTQLAYARLSRVPPELAQARQGSQPHSTRPPVALSAYHPATIRQPELLYALAACHFRARAYGAALKLVAEIVDRGVREHPELGVGRCVRRARGAEGRHARWDYCCLSAGLPSGAAYAVLIGCSALDQVGRFAQSVMLAPPF
jgi:hypothetical protein